VTGASDDLGPPRTLLALEEARRIIANARVPVVHSETVRLREALGRLAGATIHARTDVPCRPLSAMDGFAVRVSGRPTTGPLTVRGAVFPSGGPGVGLLRRGEAAYISTGAPLPRGANAVVRIEAARRTGDMLWLARPARRNQDVLPPGESVSRGDVLLSRGEPIRAVHVGAFLAQRMPRVPVARLRVSVLPIGDELVADEDPAPAGTWDYMGPTISTLLPFAQVELCPPSPDDRPRVERTLLRAARHADLLFTIGGSSVGAKDVTKAAIRGVGRLWFEGVRVNVLKRGAVGAIGKVPTVVLPGQLVSAVTVYHEHGLHLISRLVGRELRRFERATLTRGVHVDHPLDSTYLLRLSGGEATPLPWGVARMTALLQAQGFAVLDHGRSYRAGDRITVQRLWVNS